MAQHLSNPIPAPATPAQATSKPFFWRWLSLILLVLAALYLVGNGAVQLWDRDEPRYAQASRQMLASGNWVVPMVQDQPRLKKPPLIYWCQATAMKLIDNEVFAARLPSVVAMLLTLGLVGWAVRRMAGPEEAIGSVVILGTSALAIIAAKMCITDAVLLLFVTGSQFCLYAIWRGERGWPVFIALGVSLGLAILTKGPVVLGVNATTFLMLGVLRGWDAFQLRRDARGRGFEVVTPASLPASRPVAAAAAHEVTGARCTCWLGIAARIFAVLGIIAAICLPWVLALETRIPGALKMMFTREVANRMAEAAEQHGGPPGYYLAFALGSFFPWSLLMFTAMKVGWGRRRDPLTRFALAAVIGPWVMFEVIRTKLPHYVLPCFVFLAILTARALVDAVRRFHRDWTGRLWLMSLNIFALALLALGMAPWAAPALGFSDVPYGAMVTITAVAGLSAGVILGLLARERYAAGAAAMGTATAVVFGLLFGWYLPGARFLHLSEDVGNALRSAGGGVPGKAMMIDYLEDTLPFYQGGTILREGNPDYLAQTPPAQWPELISLTRDVWDKTPPGLRDRLEVLHRFRGWAYAARGRVVEVMVVRNKGK